MQCDSDQVSYATLVHACLPCHLSSSRSTFFFSARRIPGCVLFLFWLLGGGAEPVVLPNSKRHTLQPSEKHHLPALLFSFCTHFAISAVVVSSLSCIARFSSLFCTLNSFFFDHSPFFPHSIYSHSHSILPLFTFSRNNNNIKQSYSPIYH